MENTLSLTDFINERKRLILEIRSLEKTVRLLDGLIEQYNLTSRPTAAEKPKTASKVKPRYKATQCGECSKRFKSPQALSSHKRNAHVEHFDVECSECNKTFRSGQGIKNHTKRMHGNADDKKVTGTVIPVIGTPTLPSVTNWEVTGLFSEHA